MDVTTEQKPKKKEKPPTAAILAAKMESAQIRSSFGRLVLSHEKTAPKFGFGTASRDQAQLNFQSEELSSAVGKSSPGPKYCVYQRVDYQQDAQWSFGKDGRKTAQPVVWYDHYNNKEYLDDPNAADLTRRKKAPAVKFGTESAVQDYAQTVSPGPQYLPPEKPEYKAQPKFTFGYRRTLAGTSGLENQVSTTGIVGPGRYAPEQSAKTSIHQDVPKWSLPKQDRIPKPVKQTSKNQTYDITRGIGKQVLSQKRSSSSAHFGSGSRAQWDRTGTFKDMMATQPTRIVIKHPKF